MIKRVLICAVCALIVAASGCSKPKEIKKNAAPSKTASADKIRTGGESQESSVENSRSEKTAGGAESKTGQTQQTEEPSQKGTITGNIFIDDTDNRKGNLFVFIVDDSKMPKQTVVIASAFLSEKRVSAGKTPFTLKDVPAGEWSVLAVWDSSAPYCKVSEKYCRASTKDGLGMATQLVMVAPGQTAQSPDISISF